MKKRFFAFLIFFAACLLYAYGFDFHFLPVRNGDENMSVSYKIPDFFEEFTLEEEYCQEVSPDRSFKARFDGDEGEVHFILFADRGVDADNFMTEVNMWNQLILMNIDNTCESSQTMHYLNGKMAEDVNADCFGVALFVNPISEFSRDYKFAFVDSAYKKGIGICMRVFLSNSIKFLGLEKNGSYNKDSDFLKYYTTYYF